MLRKIGASISEKASENPTAEKVSKMLVEKHQKSNKSFMYVYIAFFCGINIAYQSYHDLGLSTLITFAVALQLLAYVMLATKVIQQNSVRGVSAKALQCHAVVYLSRLSTTTWLKGYIPTDSTGVWLYQTMDALSLLTVLCLLYFVFKRYRDTYQADLDTFDISYLLSGCFVLSILLHPHLNSRPFFDTMWTLALYVDVFAMLPQLWMMAKLEVGSELEALNCHYIAAIAASRAVNFYFWFYGFVEFAPKDGGFNFTGWAIMGAHVIQMLLLLDFVVFYVKACVGGCFRAIQTGDYSQSVGFVLPPSYDI